MPAAPQDDRIRTSTSIEPWHNQNTENSNWIWHKDNVLSPKLQKWDCVCMFVCVCVYICIYIQARFWIYATNALSTACPVCSSAEYIYIYMYIYILQDKLLKVHLIYIYIEREIFCRTTHRTSCWKCLCVCVYIYIYVYIQARFWIYIQQMHFQQLVLCVVLQNIYIYSTGQAVESAFDI